MIVFVDIVKLRTMSISVEVEHKLSVMYIALFGKYIVDRDKESFLLLIYFACFGCSFQILKTAKTSGRKKGDGSGLVSNPGTSRLPDDSSERKQHDVSLFIFQGTSIIYKIR